MPDTVVPENAIGTAIIELIGLGFSGHVRDVALIPAIISRVFQSRADLQIEILACAWRIIHSAGFWIFG